MREVMSHKLRIEIYVNNGEDIFKSSVSEEKKEYTLNI